MEDLIGYLDETQSCMKNPKFTNIYGDSQYAAAYATLDWGKTYHLIYRDLPRIVEQYVTGDRALDFGCGTGRSTRLLRSYGFRVTGIDIAESMVCSAHQLDPDGDYRVCSPEDFIDGPSGGVDLVLASFPFDNIPAEQKNRVFCALRNLMAPSGRLVNIVSSPEIYLHEWASFTTRPFPENADAENGDIVRIVTRDFTSGNPAEDILCTPEAYRQIYAECGFEILAEERPLGREDDGVAGLSETKIAPWTIYVLAKRETA